MEFQTCSDLQYPDDQGCEHFFKCFSTTGDPYQEFSLGLYPTF